MWKEVAEAGLSLTESQRVRDAVGKLWNVVKHGRIEIAVFGPGGTGKTTLGNILAGKFDLGGAGQAYQESIAVERYGKQGNLWATAVVVPGQEHRRESTWDKLYGTCLAA